MSYLDDKQIIEDANKTGGIYRNVMIGLIILKLLLGGILAYYMLRFLWILL